MRTSRDRRQAVPTTVSPMNSPTHHFALHRYKLYGLRIASEFELPTEPVAPSEVNDAADYRISIAASAGEPFSLPALVFRSPERGSEGEPELLIYRDDATGATRWQWCDGVTVSVEGPRIDVYCPPQEALSGVAHTIVGQVLAHLLRKRGHPLLHGSALAMGQTSFGILGPSGAGKSTLATALSLRGHWLLTDDVVALTAADGLWHALAGYSGLRLWPDSAEALLGDASAVPLLLERSACWTGFDKRYLRLCRGARAIAEAAPLRHVFVLQDRALGGPVFERLSGPAAVVALGRNAYQLMMRDAKHVRRELAAFAALAQQAAVWRVVPGDDLGAIDDLAAGIEMRLQEQ